MQTADSQTYASFILLLLVLYIAAFLLYHLPLIIVNWKLFEKAGRPGWAALVPVYCQLVIAKIGKSSTFLGVLFGLASVASFLTLGGRFTNVVLLILYFSVVPSFVRKYNIKGGLWVAYIMFPWALVSRLDSIQYSNGQPGTTDVNTQNPNGTLATSNPQEAANQTAVQQQAPAQQPSVSAPQPNVSNQTATPATSQPQPPSTQTGDTQNPSSPTQQ